MEQTLIAFSLAFYMALPLLAAWLLDRWLGDPQWMPHPVVAFGKAIAFFEHRLNHGNGRFLKGMLVSCLLVAGVYWLTAWHHKIDFRLLRYLRFPCQIAKVPS